MVITAIFVRFSQLRKRSELSGMVLVSALLLLLAVSVQSSDVSFYLFSRDNPEKYFKINSNNEDSYLSHKPQVRFLIHGWQESRAQAWYEALKNVLLARDNVLVIQVDYRNIAKEHYLASVLRIDSVGLEIANYILSLTLKGVPLENIQVIGHSLGAQISAVVGRYVFKKTGQKLSRITALDPAGPLFQGLFQLQESLNEKDAKVVLVIHTDRFKFGITSSCGTIDVYPNGGASLQPGCPEQDENPLFCSHHQSYRYYTTAISKPKSFLAYKCESYRMFLNRQCNNSRIIDIGGDVSEEDRGEYYMSTWR